MKPWYVYGLRAAGETRIRYVGYTADPKGRRLRHISNARMRRRNYPVYDWIRSLITAGIDLEMEILDQGCGDGWKEAERRRIAEFRPQGIFNICDGGYSPVVPPDARKRAGEKLKDRVFSDEHRARISEAKKGKPRPDNADRIRAVAASNVGKKMKFSETGLAGRRALGKKMGAINARKMWGTMSPEELQQRRDAASAQMKRVWADRKAKRDAEKL